jgi:hypothetical protein
MDGWMEAVTVDPLLERCGDLKGELVAFATSDRFDTALAELIFDEFPDGVVDDELSFGLTLDGFIHTHRLAGGTSLIESFTDADRALLRSWLENVQGTFEIVEMADDGFVAFNHIDELTYRVRSNMGAAGVSALSPGMIVIGRIVPVADFWMISGPMASFPADQADEVLAGVPQLQASHPEAVFRNPEKLEQGRRLQAEQRADFIAVHGSDTVVVAGAQVHEVLMAAYRHTYERHGSVDGPWTEPDFPLPDAWTGADNVAMIYDELDGLGFYVDYTVLVELFADPALLGRRRYRETLSGYLRDGEVGPVPIARLAADNPDNAGRLFAKLLKKPGFSWDRDGEAMLRRYKKHWYDNPPLPRIVPVDSRITTPTRSTRPKNRTQRHTHR